MEYFDYSEDFLEFGEALDFDIESFLEESQELEQQRLQQELERVEDLLEEREEIHSGTVDELESKLDWYLDRLREEYRQFSTDREEVEKLKAKIDKFYSELRQEKRNEWRDKIELEMKLREVERALEEVEDEDSLWRFLE